MKRIQISIFLMLALAIYSCQEYEMVQYGTGQQINFMGDYYLGQNKKPIGRTIRLICIMR